MHTDPRIDAYIANAAPFARPILAHLRKLVHDVLPGAEETIKWNMPHFTLGGKNVAGMAAFKGHCAFTVHGEGRGGSEGMGQHGKLTSLADVPADGVLADKLRAAAARIRAGGSAAPKRGKTASLAPAPLAVPACLAAALAGNAQARATFEGFAPSHRREYIDWIAEAKREDTRDKRVAQAVEWLAEGKRRNWKYEKR